MAQIKINLSFPRSLAERMDRYCKENYLTRSGLVQQAVTSFLTAHEMTSALQELTRTVKELAIDGNNKQDLERLEEVERIIELMQGGMK